MSKRSPARPDGRHCPKCDAMGILPLELPHDYDGHIVDPVMLCPGVGPLSASEDN